VTDGGERPPREAADDDELARTNDELTGLSRVLEDDARRYRILFGAAPVALMETDSNARIADANAAACELLGVEYRFILGKPLPAYVDPADRRTFRQWLADHRRAHTRARTEVRMLRRSGVRFDADVRITPVDGKVYWAITDTSELQIAEDMIWQLNRELEDRVALQASELTTLIDQLPVGVCVIDTNGRVTRANERARAILHTPVDNLHAFDFALSTLDGRDVPPEARPFARVLAGEAVAPLRLVVQRSDGSECVLDVTAAPIAGLSGTPGAVVLFDDVTERAAREQAETEFVDNAAHQLRNPVTAITSSLAALEAGARDDPEAQALFLRHIAREASRLQRLTDTLLSLARLHSGARPLVGVAALRPILESASTVNADVEIHCADHIGVVGDADMLAEAIANVVRNAAEHTSDAKVRIHATLKRSTLLIDVSDEGPGIAEEDRERVFERFVQIGPRHTSGAGLGLAIARQATRANRGTLSVVPSEQGTTFRFVLPGARVL
jgi:PAS domain S-box-containing protein